MNNGNQDGFSYLEVDELMSNFISVDNMKALMYLCLRHDIPDNNVKAEVAKKILGPSFIEVGTGTNRICFRYNGLIVKIALDRRGLVDNFTEYKRSIERPGFLAKVYETNYLINISQYIIMMDQDTFIINEESIKAVLHRLSEDYLFDDVGFALKNSCNWGVRESLIMDNYNEDDEYDDETAPVQYYGTREDIVYDVVILDYGYLYPMGDQKVALFTCPKCGGRLSWNGQYTSIGCTSNCAFTASPTAIRRRMKLEYEEQENKMISQLTQIQMPNLATMEQDLGNIIDSIKEDY